MSQTEQKRPPQHQSRQPDQTREMLPQPEVLSPNYRAAGHLRGKSAVVSGADSGIGRSVAVAFAKEGADELDVVVNNAGEQHPQRSLLDIDRDRLERTFRTNIFSMFYLTKAALPHLGQGAAIINTTSITVYRGSPQLIDYRQSRERSFPLPVHYRLPYSSRAFG